MTNQSETPNDPLTDELKKLGENLAEILQATWDRPERKVVQAELETGIAEVSRAITQATEDFKNSETGQRLKSEVDTLINQVETGKLETRLRSDVESVLHIINVELRKFTQSIKPTTDSKEDQDQSVE